MYGSEYSLRNHVSKSSGTDCSKKHTPYTSANVYSKKVLKCEYANCNGGFSSEHSRKTHYNNEHKNPSKIIKKARTTNGKVTKPKKQPRINISKKKVALSVQAKGKKHNIILRWIIFLFSSSNTHTFLLHTIQFPFTDSSQIKSTPNVATTKNKKQTRQPISRCLHCPQVFYSVKDMNSHECEEAQ